MQFKFGISITLTVVVWPRRAALWLPARRWACCRYPRSVPRRHRALTSCQSVPGRSPCCYRTRLALKPSRCCPPTDRPGICIVIVYTPQIVNRVAICPRGNLPYIQITSIMLPYIQSTNYLFGTYLSWRKSTLYADHLYSATLYPVTL